MIHERVISCPVTDVGDRTTGRLPRVTCPSDLRALSAEDAAIVGRVVGSFLDTAGTSLGRATFYNTREEQVRAEAAAHEEMLSVSRELYRSLALLPGVTEHTRTNVLRRLLERSPGEESLDESPVIRALLASVTTPRRLRLFGALRRRRVNNARNRRLILREILGHRNLEFLAVKYRRKTRVALEHAFGKRRSSVLVSILMKQPSDRSISERRLVRREIDRYAGGREFLARDAVAFVFGRVVPHRPLFAAYRGARERLAAGRGLPPEVLEGIRGVYHPWAPPADVLSIAADAMTTVQRIQVQKRAERAEVEVRFDPRNYDATRLYLYAFERGEVADDVGRALDAKARAGAAELVTGSARVGVLIDASASMAGRSTQALRPIATALAIRDVLAATATERALVHVAGGAAEGRLVRPEGDSSLAHELVVLLRESPDVVYVITDGYENAPAGRFEEVLSVVREIGIGTPVFQVSPVFAAESKGLRRIGPSLVPAVPVMGPEGLGPGLLRARLESEPVAALEELWARCLPVPRDERTKRGGEG